MGVRVTDRNGFGEKEVVVFRTEAPNDVAGYAMLLLEKWSLVAAMPDGEDSAGRAKLRLPTTDELVERAFDIATKAFDIARARGMMVRLPDLNDVNAENDVRTAQEKADALRRRLERETAP